MRRATRILPQGFASASTARVQTPIIHTFRSRPQCLSSTSATPTVRTFHVSVAGRKENYASQAKELNQKGLDDQEADYSNQLDDQIGKAKELQARTPWHREGSDKPPVKRMRSAGAMTKGCDIHPFSPQCGLYAGPKLSNILS